MSTIADELPKQYHHAEPERKWFDFWASNRYFHSEPTDPGEKYTIVIPPPNVTGALHLGHALNNTLQDVLIRFKRMQGYNALWMPGTDHAGIATQAVVERRLLQDEKKSRHDLGRTGLVERIWKWKNDYEQRILGQLKRLGASCDWERTRFTLDEVCARAVRRTFFSLFKEGLIYRGKRLVNWDTYLQTAVSDDEVENVTIDGHFWQIRYEVLDTHKGEPSHVTVATTRPETMLGDTAVAVHPDPAAALDKVEKELREKLAAASEKERPAVQAELDVLAERRKTHLPLLIQLRDMAKAGRRVRLPLLGRSIPLVADEWAKPEMGTGCVKITPAHDPNDYDVGKRQKLPMINILNPDGTLNEDAGPYRGLTIAQARVKVVADLAAAGLHDPEKDVEARKIELPMSDRSKTPIEPYLADQWFVKMDNLAQSAMDAVTDERVKIFPSRYAKTYLDWLGEKRDWPVSRQLWWGHRIPIWYCETCEAADLRKAFAGRTDVLWHHDGEGETWMICALGDLSEDAIPGHKLKQDSDVLDTWFSSALWPHSTLGWPGPALTADGPDWEQLKSYYPTSTLITSRDIITLWVARMVLMSIHNVKQNPLPSGEGGERSSPGEGKVAGQPTSSGESGSPHPASGHLLPEGEGTGVVPFKEVFIHPKILDAFGDTMSKSKGNGVDPLDVIDKFGADSLRFGLAYLTTETQDVRMPVDFECPHCGELIEQTKKNRVQPRVDCKKCGKPFRTQWAEKPEDVALPRGAVVSERFELARNFCNKLWNAARFAMLNLDGYTAARVTDAELTVEDRWVLSRLNTVTAGVTDDLNHYRYADAMRKLYEFAWDEFCSFYVEMVKGRLQDPAARGTAQRVLTHVLDVLVRLLHPAMPFITEEIWQRLGEFAPQRGLEPSPVGRGQGEGMSQASASSTGKQSSLTPALSRRERGTESVMIAEWPAADASRIDPTIEARFARFQEMLRGLRDIRARQNITPKTAIRFSLKCDAATADLLRPMGSYFASMAGAEATGWGEAVQPFATTATLTLPFGELYVDLEGLIDVAAEIVRKEKERDNLANLIRGKESKLGNASFVERAPPEVVTKERQSLDEARRTLESVERSLVELRAKAK